MIATIVEFQLPEPISLALARERFLGTAPRYRAKPGLIRKHYFLSEDGWKAGGIYFWVSRADAERVFTEEWKAFVRGKYGTDPRLTYLRCPVVVDNVADEIRSDE